nr:MAG TPA: hypothetical protein [Bacteriophage sp.]
MIGYELPKTINIEGVDYDIRTDFRAILDILIFCDDPDLEPYERQEVMYEILYIDYEKIPVHCYQEACQKALEFIDGGLDDKKKQQKKVLDWKQDAALIMPAVNKIAGKELRTESYIHWWTFLGYFMEIEDGLFSQVLSIRQRKAKHKKLEKWERDFERENADLVRIHTTQSEEQKREIANLEKWL